MTKPAARVTECRAFGQQADPEGQEAETAAWCVQTLKDWDECLLWVTAWGEWRSSEDWPTYHSARGVQGERRSLEIAPGHLFAGPEAGLLRGFLRLVLENAWDAYLLPAHRRQRISLHIVVSHDEWVEIRDSS